MSTGTKLSTINISTVQAEELDAAFTHHNSWRLRRGEKKLTKHEFTGMIVGVGIASLASTPDKTANGSNIL